MAYDIAMLLADWEAMGVFDYVLPFLLIFAVIYGILTATRVFSGNKGVNIMIALTIGMLSLRFDYVPLFFSEIFPRFGAGIAVFLVLTILTALFIPTKYFQGWGIGFSILGLLIGAVVVYNSFEKLGWLGGGGWWDEYGSLIILAVGIVVVVVALTFDKSAPNTQPVEHKQWRAKDD